MITDRKDVFQNALILALAGINKIKKDSENSRTVTIGESRYDIIYKLNKAEIKEVIE